MKLKIKIYYIVIQRSTFQFYLSLTNTHTHIFQFYLSITQTGWLTVLSVQKFLFLLILYFLTSNLYFSKVQKMKSSKEEGAEKIKLGFFLMKKCNIPIINIKMSSISSFLVNCFYSQHSIDFNARPKMMATCFLFRETQSVQQIYQLGCVLY